MKSIEDQDRTAQPYDLKTKALISMAAGAMSFLFGSGVLYANPSWGIALGLFTIAISVSVICFSVPWCAKQVAPNAD